MQIATLQRAVLSMPSIADDARCGYVELFLKNESKSSPNTLHQDTYAVELTRKHLKFQSSGCKPFVVELRENESEGIQKLSLAFVKLLEASKLSKQEDAEVLDWKDVNPVITLTKSGITIRFVKNEDKELDSESDSKKPIFWKFFTRFAKIIFEKRLKELNVAADDGDDDFLLNGESAGDSNDFKNFIETLWKIMKISVDYAENNFKGWTTFKPETMQPEINDEIIQRKFVR